MTSSNTGRPVALLFDVDGTLIDTMPIHFRAWREAVEAEGMTFLGWDAFIAQGGTAAEDLIERLATEQNAEPNRQAILDHKTRRLHALVDETAPIERAVRLAKEFRAGGGPVGLVTGGRLETVSQSLEHHGLAHLGERVLITPADLEPGRGKPFPDGLQLACQRLQVDPVDCLYVGDSPLDRSAAESAGLRFIHVDDLPATGWPWA